LKEVGPNSSIEASGRLAGRRRQRLAEAFVGGTGRGHVLHGASESSGWRGAAAMETAFPVSPNPNHPPSALQEKTMREDTEIRIPQDDERIDVTDLKEVDYWTQWFGVSEARLRTAVASAGTVKDDLRIYLGLP
jgi:hypothetical protein